MNFKSKINKTLKIQYNVLEEKIDTYLKNNYYRITERGAGYIIFIEDEFSDRKRARSDFRTRIGGGKFIFSNLHGNETHLELIYFTSLSYYAFLVMLISAFGIYTNNITMPIVLSLFLAIPIVVRILYLNGRVFEDIMKL